MALSKKDFQALADMTATIEDDQDRERFMKRIIPFCRGQNALFDEWRFREWIKRRINGESTKGLG